MKKLLLLSVCMLLVCGMSFAKNSDIQNKKYIALTFDDGPDNEKTSLVLDKLDKYGVVATFLMVGQNINDNTKPTIKRVIKMGNEIANHSFSYEGMQNMTPKQINDSVEKTTNLIKKYSGTTPKFFRAPNLATSTVMYKNIDMPFVSGIIGFDWAGQNTSAQDRANFILKDVKDGAIILLHDVQPYPHPTPEALDIIIPELQKQGYEFVTLSKLFELKGIKTKKNEEKSWVIVE